MVGDTDLLAVARATILVVWPLVLAVQWAKVPILWRSPEPLFQRFDHKTSGISGSNGLATNFSNLLEI